MRRQRGVVLIVAMVMLVIIGLMSVSVMRGALNTDVVANNTRSQTLAMQTAQIGLRYCERNLSTGTVPVQNAPVGGGANWQVFSNWFGASPTRTEIPLAVLADGDSSFTPKRPQCMIEKTVLADGSQAFIVTARGFSPDYTEDTSGRAVTGAAIWLQSTVKQS